MAMATWHGLETFMKEGEFLGTGVIYSTQLKKLKTRLREIMKEGAGRGITQPSLHLLAEYSTLC